MLIGTSTHSSHRSGMGFDFVLTTEEKMYKILLMVISVPQTGIFAFIEPAVCSVVFFSSV